MTANHVLTGSDLWSVEQGDAIAWLDGLPAGSLDLLFCSPPYEKARIYLENGVDLGIARKTEEWVAWLVNVTKAALRACKGLVALVVEGQTKNFRYSAGPALLMADLHRAGITLRKPPIFHRIGIPGSGGPDWLRNDHEFIVCATNGGKLPWSDNTACGHAPKWLPGGAMSNRLSGGRRVARGHAKGDTLNSNSYFPPARANPGNTIHDSLLLAELIWILSLYEQTTSATADQVLRELRTAADACRLQQWFYGVCLQVEATAFLQSAMRQPEARDAQPELPAVWRENGENGLSGRDSRKHSGVSDEAVLQSQMSGSVCGVAEWPKTRRLATSRKKDSEANDAANLLRDVRGNEAAGSPPPRPGRHEQSAGESSSSLLAMPSAGSQERRMRRSGLYESVYGLGILQQALPAIQEAWRSVSQMLRARQAPEGSSLISCNVGGGRMGHELAHANEAPYPVSLCDFFVRSFCPPGGIVGDCFSGSGTTLHASVIHGRRFVGCDLRQSQVDLAIRRAATLTPNMF